ncbi:LysR family transcriptional regulator [Luteibacter sp. dw_328]|uniref:LysR family transcriptional regulator n=1 Tax=Luteibacter sp. dw_328 TaxID=2719796 RepID=UPI001BD597CA|nr:LysR family transcriptional regulator [Luteibacter sp. dw_328]
MDRLDAMQLFVRVADSGSFSKAAISSGVSQSTVSKQIAAIESRLGVQLLRRTTRGLSVTEAGQQYYESILQLIEAVDAAEARVGHAQVAPTGVLRVAISAAFGRFFVLPYLPEFFALYPEMTIDFDISERHANLVEDGIDVAIRIGALSDSSLVARRIGGVRFATVGTPAYFERYGVPQHPRDIETMPCVVFMFQGASRAWRFAENGGPLVVDGKPVIRTNDAEHIRGSVLAGLGMGHNPGWLYARDIAEGRLQQVLAGYSPPAFPISAVSPAGRRQTRKAQVFTEFLAARFSSIPELSLSE